MCKIQQDPVVRFGDFWREQPTIFDHDGKYLWHFSASLAILAPIAWKIVESKRKKGIYIYIYIAHIFMYCTQSDCVICKRQKKHTHTSAETVLLILRINYIGMIKRTVT